MVCREASGRLYSGMVMSAMSLRSNTIAWSGLEPAKAASAELMPFGCVMGVLRTLLVIFNAILKASGAPEQPAKTPSNLSPVLVVKTTCRP